MGSKEFERAINKWTDYHSTWGKWFEGDYFNKIKEEYSSEAIEFALEKVRLRRELGKEYNKATWLDFLIKLLPEDVVPDCDDKEELRRKILRWNREGRRRVTLRERLLKNVKSVFFQGAATEVIEELNERLHLAEENINELMVENISLKEKLGDVGDAAHCAYSAAWKASREAGRNRQRIRGHRY